MANQKKKRPTVYYSILALTSILLLIGLVMIASASSVIAYVQHKDSFFFLWRQIRNAAMGLVLLFIASRVDRKWFNRVSPIGMIISAVLLVLVVVAGEEGGGASRWLAVGGVIVQPSEFAKLAVVLFCADILSRKRNDGERLKGLIWPLGVPLGTVFGLILVQPDLGTAIIIALAVFAMLFLVGIRFRELVPLAIGGTAVTVGLIAAAPYRRERMLAFLDPWGDRLGNGFQLIQSLLALGSGGVTGVGLGLSRQKFGYLPAPHTDFIYAVIGEELGLGGTLGVLILYLLLALAVMTVVRRCDDLFGKLLAAGVGTMIIGQALVNIGGVTGVLPITGVPLPLISFGGSSLWLTMASIGILLNLTTGKAKKRRGTKRENTDLRRGDGGTRLPRPRSGRSA